MCVVGKMFFVVFYVFPPGVYVGINLIASIPGPSILTLYILVQDKYRITNGSTNNVYIFHLLPSQWFA